MHHLNRLLAAGLLLLSLAGTAQKSFSLSPDSPGGCYLPPSTSTETFSRPYIFSDRMRPKELTYNINYIPAGDTVQELRCETWPPEAAAALEYGVSIWSDVLQSDRAIDVDACYTNSLTGNTLGSASASLVLIGPYFGRELVVYPKALAEYLYDVDSDGADIQVFINGNFAANFYYGTDAAPPSGLIDFVTLTVHEMGHGLGFSGSARIDDGQGTPECDSIAGHGCIGFPANTSTGIQRIPNVYDLFADLGADGTPLVELTPNPGTELADALIGQRGGLNFDETNYDDFAGGSSQLPLYTPTTFQRGSSYSHFSAPDEVMYFSLSRGTANHDVGQAARVMQNLGWREAITASLPVELLTFAGAPADRGVALIWETATEVNNETFEIEASRDGRAFTQIGTLPGRGTTTAPTTYTFLDEAPAAGSNLYRLRQLDHDGRVTYSDVIGVHVGVDGIAVSEVYPNPGRTGTVYLDYRSEGPRQVTSTLHDASGRPLRRRRTELPAGFSRLTVDVAGLPRGMYLLKLDDGGEPVVRRVVVE